MNILDCWQRSISLFVLAELSLLLLGCDSYLQKKSADSSNQDFERRLEALERPKEPTEAWARPIGDLNARLDALEAKLEKLSNQQFYNDLIRDSDSVAYLTPGDEGYTTVRTNIGFLTINLVNVQEYANGSRVTLRFGNLTSAIVTGLHATLEWGKTDSRGLCRANLLILVR